MGDWMVNYANGFIRRGATGQAALWLGELPGLNPGRVIAFFQCSAYAVYFGFSYALLFKQERLAPFLLLVVAPYIFTFQLLVEGCHRKEILLFAVFALVVWLAATRSTETFLKWFYPILGAYPLLILSHEGLAGYLPYLLVVYLWKVPLTQEPQRGGLPDGT